MMMLAFAVNSSAQQCAAKNITLPKDGTALTLTGKTGGCNKFRFSITKGQRLTAKLTSDDDKARLGLGWADGEDETGSDLWEGMTTFSEVLNYEDWDIWVTGSASTSFTLKIKVTDE